MFGLHGVAVYPADARALSPDEIREYQMSLEPSMTNAADHVDWRGMQNAFPYPHDEALSASDEAEKPPALGGFRKLLQFCLSKLAVVHNRGQVVANLPDDVDGQE